MLAISAHRPTAVEDYPMADLLAVPETSETAERKTSNLLTINWRPSTSQEKTEFEVTLDKDREFAGGLAFRIIGSRNSGIFVDQIEEKSVQNGYLKQGDKIIACGERRLSGLTPEQAAGILRFQVQRTGQIRLRVERNERGEELIVRRRSMTCVAFEEDKSWQQEHEMIEMSNQISEMRQSASASSLESRKRTYRVVPSRSTAFLQLSPDEEKEELLTPKPRQRQMRSFYSFDTSDLSEKSICTICNKETRLLTLHFISHRCAESARRLIPNSHSDGAFSANYRLL